jgi:hypothetical protein
MGRRSRRVAKATERFAFGSESSPFVCLSTSYPATLPACEFFFVDVKRSCGARSARPVFPALRGVDRCCQPLFSAPCVGPSAPTDHRKCSLAPRFIQTSLLLATGERCSMLRPHSDTTTFRWLRTSNSGPSLSSSQERSRRRAGSIEREWRREARLEVDCDPGGHDYSIDVVEDGPLGVCDLDPHGAVIGVSAPIDLDGFTDDSVANPDAIGIP